MEDLDTKMANKYKKVKLRGCLGLRGYVYANYYQLVKLFGEPNGGKSMDGKVSTQWTLQDDHGQVVTIYDYKETSLYSSTAPSVEEFREKPSYSWHIGAQKPFEATMLKRYVEQNLDRSILTVQEVVHKLDRKR